MFTSVSVRSEFDSPIFFFSYVELKKKMFRTRTGRGSIQLLAEIQVGRSGGLHGHSPWSHAVGDRPDKLARPRSCDCGGGPGPRAWHLHACPDITIFSYQLPMIRLGLAWPAVFSKSIVLGSIISEPLSESPQGRHQQRRCAFVSPDSELVRVRVYSLDSCYVLLPSI